MLVYLFIIIPLADTRHTSFFYYITFGFMGISDGVLPRRSFWDKGKGVH